MKKQKREKPAPDKDIVSATGTPEEVGLSVNGLNPEDLEKLPEETRLAVIQGSSFSGPLPPPALYKEYEAVLSGSATRILTMAEKEQDQRHTFDGKALAQHSEQIKRGQNIGGIVALVCVCGAVFCAVTGQLLGAAILLSAPLVSLVSRFVNAGRSSR